MGKLSFTGIGVSNLNKSSIFYQKILNLEEKGRYENVEIDLSDGNNFYIDEIVLGEKNSDENLLILMNWPKEDRNYSGLNSKIVFSVEDAKKTIELIRLNGGIIDREALPHYTIEGGLVALARDFDDNVVEIDLSDGSKFYIDEIVLGEKDSEENLLILMNWPKEERNYNGLNSKIVFSVEDAKKTIELIRSNGGKIDREALPHYTIEGGLVALARDFDDNVVEIVQWAN